MNDSDENGKEVELEKAVETAVERPPVDLVDLNDWLFA